MGFLGGNLAAMEALSAFGFLYISTPAGTSVVTGGTYYKVAGTTTAGTERNFTHTNGRLTYIGSETRLFSVDISISMTSSNNITTHWRIAKNGVTVANSEQERLVGTGGDVGNASIHAEVELATDDYVEVFCTTESGQDAKTVTAERMTLTVE